MLLIDQTPVNQSGLTGKLQVDEERTHATALNKEMTTHATMAGRVDHIKQLTPPGVTRTCGKPVIHRSVLALYI